MSNSLVKIMKSAIPLLKFENELFRKAFLKAYNGLLTDAEASGYDLGITSPEVTDDPYIFLDEVVKEINKPLVDNDEVLDDSPKKVEPDSLNDEQDDGWLDEDS